MGGGHQLNCCLIRMWPEQTGPRRGKDHQLQPGLTCDWAGSPWELVINVRHMADNATVMLLSEPLPQDECGRKMQRGKVSEPPWFRHFPCCIFRPIILLFFFFFFDTVSCRRFFNWGHAMYLILHVFYRVCKIINNVATNKLNKLTQLFF